MTLIRIFSLIACMTALCGPAIADDDDDDDQGQDTGTAEIVVRCDRGGSINDALALADGSSRLTIIVRGTCVERVSIGIDNVTVRGDGAFGGRIEGRFFVDARRVVIENLTISGDDRGIRAFHGAYVVVRDVVIENMSETGIFALNGGVVIAERVTVIGPVVDGFIAGTGGVLDIRDSEVRDSEFGVAAGTGSTVNVERTAIIDTTGDGLQILQNSTARLVEVDIAVEVGTAMSVTESGFVRMRNSTIRSTNSDGPVLFLDGGGIRLDGGNVMVGANPFDSFALRNGAYLRQRVNLGDGADVLEGGMLVESLSVASLADVEYAGSVRVRRHAELEVRALEPGGVQIDGDINVSEDALLVFRGAGGVVTGDVTCVDEESSLSIATADAVFNGAVVCSGFD